MAKKVFNTDIDIVGNLNLATVPLEASGTLLALTSQRKVVQLSPEQARMNIGSDKLSEMSDIATFDGLDIRYYTETEVDGFLATKSDTGHTHDQYQDLSEKGTADGYVPLDSGAKIPVSYIPESVIDKYYRHYQGTPSNTWTITHNLNKRPSVMITDSAGTVCTGDIEYIDNNQLIVTFNGSFSGYAELN